MRIGCEHHGERCPNEAVWKVRGQHGDWIRYLCEEHKDAYPTGKRFRLGGM
jgi:hypothetical protein